MSAQMIDLNLFNLARESYMGKDIFQAILTLESINGLDLSLIKDELANKSGNSRYLQNLINSRSEDLVGVFDCPYHPYLLLEYTKIKDVLPTIIIDSKFSNIRCVKQIESTVGIGNEQVVAIFPENFRSITASGEHPVFYFVDKFAKRHLKYTRPLLRSFQNEPLFRPLNSLSENKIGELISNWVNIHEASHRTGVMPIPKYLNEKSNRFTAAIEELRADLITINKCLSYGIDEQTDEYLTGLYVLAERLLAYPLFRKRTNFDAISSIIMWKFLNEENVFETNIAIHKMKSSIENLISFISKLEVEALGQRTMESRKAKLMNLTVQYLGSYDEEFQKYKNMWSLK